MGPCSNTGWILVWDHAVILVGSYGVGPCSNMQLDPVVYYLDNARTIGSCIVYHSDHALIEVCHMDHKLVLNVGSYGVSLGPYTISWIKCSVSLGSWTKSWIL